MAGFVEEAGMPAARVASRAANPELARVRLFGARRSRTLRARARAWEKIRRWTMVSSGLPFPRGAEEMLDYLASLTEGGCGPSVPVSVASALRLLETAGGVPPGQRLSEDPVWRAAVEAAVEQAQHSAPPPRKAPTLPIAMVISFELYVVNESYPRYQRGYAWVKLVKLWACLRTNDVFGLDPARMSLGAEALTLVLTQSKTTGPGKKHREVKCYVHRLASISGKDWLLSGFRIWQSKDYGFERDYFLPLAGADMDKPLHRMAHYSDAAANSRALLRALKVPAMKEGVGWTERDLHLLPEGLEKFWSEHSERHWLPSVAAAHGVSKGERDFVGRWGIDRCQSNDYVLTSRQIVLGIQRRVLCWLHEGDPGYYEDELHGEIRDFAEKMGVEIGLPLRRIRKVMVSSPGGGGMLGYRFPSLNLDRPSKEGSGSDGEAEEEGPSLGEPQGGTSGGKEPAAPYWVSITRKSGFRRLHRTGGCGVHKVSAPAFEDLEEVSMGCADDYCHLCWPRLGQAAAPLVAAPAPGGASESEVGTGESESSSSPEGPASSSGED